MLGLPPVPLHLGWHERVWLGRDHYVHVGTWDYSVDLHLIGRLVDVYAGLTAVTLHREERLAADHGRVWAHRVTSPTRRRRSRRGAALGVPAAARHREGSAGGGRN